MRNQDGASELTAGVRREAVRVALLSIGLAILLELLQIVLEGATGADYRPSTAARDTLLKLPWAVMVCLSLWLAITLAGYRPATIAFAGLIAAPIASLLARSCAELAHAYTMAAAPSTTPPPLLVAGLKGAEYACLGLAVIWLRRHEWSAALHHAGAGLLVGLPFGALLLFFTAILAPGPLTADTVVAWLVNELLFPIGCALVLFVGGRPVPA